MTPSGEPQSQPSDPTKNVDTSNPMSRPQSEAELDWLENQKRSRWSKVGLDVAIIGFTLLVLSLASWAVLWIWKH